jgi:hypothetical protein
VGEDDQRLDAASLNPQYDIEAVALYDAGKLQLTSW